MRLSRNVLLLAAASFLADVSGEMLLAVLPFLLVAQGATGVGLGVFTGASEALGHLLKPVAGRIADATGRRKPLILGGYVAAALARIGIALASTWPVSLAFRAADRAGKGVRTAPRDALLAESVDAGDRGRAFGLHRAADTAGAVVGVGLALAALWAWGEGIAARVVLAGAFIGLLTVAPLAFLREVGAPQGPRAQGDEPGSPRFTPFVLLAALFAAGNVSYVFFVLRAADVVGPAGGVALYLLFNVVYFLAAYPLGRIADQLGKPQVLVVSWSLFALAAAALMPAPSVALAVGAFVVMGLSFAGFDGVGRALAADLAGTRRRATRLGVYHAAMGLAALVGGIVAGVLWDAVGAWATFAWAALVSLLGAVGLAIFARGTRGSPPSPPDLRRRA